MNYLGGKFRQGKMIARFINEELAKDPNRLYVEPFCGALGVAHRVDFKTALLSDYHTPLVNMWKAIVHGGAVLPDLISEDEYQAVKAVKDPTDWRTAYYGYGMSFAAKYWGGYARLGRGPEFALNKRGSVNLKRSTSAKRDALLGKTVEFRNVGYNELTIPDGSVVYLDPPYRDRTTQSKFTFDSDAFWEWADKLSRRCTVFVTEFITPEDWRVLHDFGDTVCRHHGGTTWGDGTSEVLVTK